MLNQVKSELIIKNIFANVINERKLKLLSYNKSLQNKLKDYRRYSERYIIFDDNGKGKEYNSFNDNLIFEGEYLKGKRNGKGIEYNNDGNIIFEGEYLKGKRNGKGIEFNNDGTLIYEGEYANGERNGKGKEFNLNGDLIFDGIYMNGEKWERVKRELDKYNGKLNFERKYKYGKINVREKEYNDIIFIGEYINGKRNGKGKEYIGKNKILIFEGEYMNGHRKKERIY